jgi:hypothetical protein
MSRTIIESLQLTTSRQFDLACRHRDLAAMRRLAVKIHRHVRPGEPADLSRVRFMMRCYAGEMYGWDIP